MVSGLCPALNPPTNCSMMGPPRVATAPPNPTNAQLVLLRVGGGGRGAGKRPPDIPTT